MRTLVDSAHISKHAPFITDLRAAPGLGDFHGFESARVLQSIEKRFCLDGTLAIALNSNERIPSVGRRDFPVAGDD